MQTLLLLLIVVLLLMDLCRHRDCGGAPPAVGQPQDSISRQVRSAEVRIKRVTDQALQAMVAEARQWTPGGKR